MKTKKITTNAEDRNCRAVITLTVEPRKNADKAGRSPSAKTFGIIRERVFRMLSRKFDMVTMPDYRLEKRYELKLRSRKPGQKRDSRKVALKKNRLRR